MFVYKMSAPSVFPYIEIFKALAPIQFQNTFSCFYLWKIPSAKIAPSLQIFAKSTKIAQKSPRLGMVEASQRCKDAKMQFLVRLYKDYIPPNRTAQSLLRYRFFSNHCYVFAASLLLLFDIFATVSISRPQKKISASRKNPQLLASKSGGIFEVFIIFNRFHALFLKCDGLILAYFLKETHIR